MIAEGDKVGVRFTMQGANTGPFLDREASGKTFTWPGMAVYRILDGTIVEEWILWSGYYVYSEIRVVNVGDRGARCVRLPTFIRMRWRNAERPQRCADYTFSREMTEADVEEWEELTAAPPDSPASASAGTAGWPRWAMAAVAC